MNTKIYIHPFETRYNDTRTGKVKVRTFLGTDLAGQECIRKIVYQYIKVIDMLEETGNLPSTWNQHDAGMSKGLLKTVGLPSEGGRLEDINDEQVEKWVKALKKIEFKGLTDFAKEFGYEFSLGEDWDNRHTAIQQSKRRALKAELNEAHV